jgi:hypothetical protein
MAEVEFQVRWLAPLVQAAHHGGWHKRSRLQPGRGKGATIPPEGPCGATANLPWRRVEAVSWGGSAVFHEGDRRSP